jgi:hypothetical protein
LWNCSNIWDAITHGYTHEILTFQAAENIELRALHQ